MTYSSENRRNTLKRSRIERMIILHTDLVCHEETASVEEQTEHILYYYDDLNNSDGDFVGNEKKRTSARSKSQEAWSDGKSWSPNDLLGNTIRDKSTKEADCVAKLCGAQVRHGHFTTGLGTTTGEHSGQHLEMSPSNDSIGICGESNSLMEAAEKWEFYNVRDDAAQPNDMALNALQFSGFCRGLIAFANLCKSESADYWCAPVATDCHTRAELPQVESPTVVDAQNAQNMTYHETSEGEVHLSKSTLVFVSLEERQQQSPAALPVLPKISSSKESLCMPGSKRKSPILAIVQVARCSENWHSCLDELPSDNAHGSGFFTSKIKSTLLSPFKAKDQRNHRSNRDRYSASMSQSSSFSRCDGFDPFSFRESLLESHMTFLLFRHGIERRLILGTAACDEVRAKVEKQLLQDVGSALAYENDSSTLPSSLYKESLSHLEELSLMSLLAVVRVQLRNVNKELQSTKDAFTSNDASDSKGGRLARRLQKLSNQRNGILDLVDDILGHLPILSLRQDIQNHYDAYVEEESIHGFRSVIQLTPAPLFYEAKMERQGASLQSSHCHETENIAERIASYLLDQFREQNLMVDVSCFYEDRLVCTYKSKSKVSRGDSEICFLDDKPAAGIIHHLMVSKCFLDSSIDASSSRGNGAEVGTLIGRDQIIDTTDTFKHVGTISNQARILFASSPSLSRVGCSQDPEDVVSLPPFGEVWIPKIYVQSSTAPEKDNNVLHVALCRVGGRFDFLFYLHEDRHIAFQQSYTESPSEAPKVCSNHNCQLLLSAARVLSSINFDLIINSPSCRQSASPYFGFGCGVDILCRNNENAINFKNAIRRQGCDTHCDQLQKMPLVVTNALYDAFAEIRRRSNNVDRRDQKKMCTLLAQCWLAAKSVGSQDIYMLLDSKKYVTVADVENVVREVFELACGS